MSLGAENKKPKLRVTMMRLATNSRTFQLRSQILSYLLISSSQNVGASQNQKPGVGSASISLKHSFPPGFLGMKQCKQHWSVPGHHRCPILTSTVSFGVALSSTSSSAICNPASGSAARSD